MTNPCPFCALLKAPHSNATFIAEFANSTAFLNFDQDAYHGQSLLILKEHHDHLHLTPFELQQAVIPELAKLTAGVLKAFGGFRANHQSLGNQVSHVHWHVIPRYPNDRNAGGHPTYAPEYKKLSDDEYRTLSVRIRDAL